MRGIVFALLQEHVAAGAIPTNARFLYYELGAVTSRTALYMVCQQVSTRPTTVTAIMRSRHFGVGVEDVRAGRCYPAAFDAWDGDEQWNYERGRAWALLAPGISLKRKGKLNPDAVRAFVRHQEFIL